MANFEGVVRPFQLPSNAPSQQYLTPGQASNPPLFLMFGRSGSGRTFSASYSKTVSKYCDQADVEKTSSKYANDARIGYNPSPWTATGSTASSIGT